MESPRRSSSVWYPGRFSLRRSGAIVGFPAYPRTRSSRRPTTAASACSPAVLPIGERPRRSGVTIPPGVRRESNDVPAQSRHGDRERVSRVDLRSSWSSQVLIMAMSARAVLLIQGGPNEGGMISLSDGMAIIGRSAFSDIVVDEQGISRQYAGVRGDREGFWISDLGSRNGTFVSGVRIGQEPQRLRNFDRIELGGMSTHWVYMESQDTIEMSRPPVGQQPHVPAPPQGAPPQGPPFQGPPFQGPPPQRMPPQGPPPQRMPPQGPAPGTRG